jgi:hypothetical protein
MTLPWKVGDTVSYEDVRRWEQELHDQRLVAALKRAREGVNHWQSLCDKMGRNELPDLLAHVWTQLPRNQLIKAVGDTWTSCEVPEQRFPRREWLPIFRAAGYHNEEEPASPPASITLWRGGIKKTRMAWTADRERAEWFQHRYEHIGKPGKLWTITLGPDRLLARYHEKQRHENEYVIDPTGIRPKQI